MPTVALFGGSFNPPHVVHQMVALYVIETALVDELWMVPTWGHPFGKELASFDDRVAMCELAAAGLGPRVSVSRVEAAVAAQHGGVSRTLHTIEHLAEIRPDIALRLVIGADILADTPKWHRWDDVVRRAPPIVIGAVVWLLRYSYRRAGQEDLTRREALGELWESAADA